ncbi:hypothetical protein Bca101_044497 [Brassica carinata]
MTQDTDLVCHASPDSTFGRRKQGEQRSISTRRRSQENCRFLSSFDSQSNLRFISGCSPSRRGIKSRPSLQLEDESNKRWICSWTRNEIIGGSLPRARIKSSVSLFIDDESYHRWPSSWTTNHVIAQLNRKIFPCARLVRLAVICQLIRGSSFGDRIDLLWKRQSKLNVTGVKPCGSEVTGKSLA